MTSFTRADASRIRKGLDVFDFTRSLEGQNRRLFENYFSFYNFDPQLAIEADHTAGVINTAGFDVVIQHFHQPSNNCQGTVVLLHGYFDHTGLYKHIIKHCLNRQLDVVIFDFPGHGLSSGLPASIQTFDQYSEVLLAVLEVMEKGQQTGPWSLVGQSTGAAVLIDSLLKNKISKRYPVTNLIALAPLLRPFAWKTSRVLYALSRPFLSSSKRNFSVNSHDEEFLSFLKSKDPLQSRHLMRDWITAMIEYQKGFNKAQSNNARLTIIQGTADTTVDWKYNLEKIAAKFPDSIIHTVTGARHHLVNESEDYRTQVFSLLDSALEMA